MHHEVDPLAERGTRWVTLLTLVTMAVEITAGWAFNSMALLADGWHMGTHAFALGLAAFAYAYARTHAADPRFAFGVWKVEALAGFTSALILLGVAFAMAWESFDRLRHPLPISFEQAILVAVLGLVVNVVCALILHRSHGHGHAHEAADAAGYDHPHQDLNLRSAYIHVITDAATSVLAIIALIGGRWLGWSWLDPLMGLVGALLVTLWARSLLRDTARVLLDAEMDSPKARQIRAALHGLDIHNLHLMRIGRDRYLCLISVIGTTDEIRVAVWERLEAVGGVAVLYVKRLEPADPSSAAHSVSGSAISIQQSLKDTPS